MLSLTKKSAVVFLAVIIAACKPTADSKLKTLDQLTGSSQKNECRGSYSDYFFDLEVGADPATKISEKEKKALSNALQDTYTAIPTLVKLSFAGTVGIYLTNNIESRCPELNKAGLGSREIDACIEATNHSDASQAPFTLYLKADAPAIRNSMLRAFAFFLAEFPGGAPKKWSKELQQASPENMKFAELFESQSRDLFNAFAEDLKSNGKSFPGIDSLASQPANSGERTQFAQLLFAETFDSYFCNPIDAGSRNTRKSMQANFPRTTAAFAPFAKIFESMDDQIAQNLQRKDQGFSLAEGASPIEDMGSEFALNGGRLGGVTPPSEAPIHTWSNKTLEDYVGKLQVQHRGFIPIARGPRDAERRQATLATLRQNADKPRTWTQALTMQRTPANAYRHELQRTALDFRGHERLIAEARGSGLHTERDPVYQLLHGNRGDPFLGPGSEAGDAVQDPGNRAFNDLVRPIVSAVASGGTSLLKPDKALKTAWGLYRGGVERTGKDSSSNGEPLYRSSGRSFNPVGLATTTAFEGIDRAQVNTAKEGNRAHRAIVDAMNGKPGTPRLLGTSAFRSSLINETSPSNGMSYQLPLPSQNSRSSSQEPFGGRFPGNRSPSSILTDPFFGRPSGSAGSR